MAPHGPLPHGERGFAPCLSPGTRTGLGGPSGFPTFKTLPVTAQLKNAGVNLLGQASKKESLVLSLAVSFFLTCCEHLSQISEGRELIHTTQCLHNIRLETRVQSSVLMGRKFLAQKLDNKNQLGESSCLRQYASSLSAHLNVLNVWIATSSNDRGHLPSHQKGALGILSFQGADNEVRVIQLRKASRLRQSRGTRCLFSCELGKGRHTLCFTGSPTISGCPECRQRRSSAGGHATVDQVAILTRSGSDSCLRCKHQGKPPLHESCHDANALRLLLNKFSCGGDDQICIV